MTEHRHGQSRFRELVGADLSVELAETLIDWIVEAHDVAARMNGHRYDSPRGQWNNTTSYGTDRYQYLLATAEQVAHELPRVHVSTPQNSLLLHIGARCTIYQFHAVGNTPLGPLLNESEVQRTLAGAEESEWALFTKAQSLLGDRELILMPWAEDADGNYSQVWVGQGTRGSGAAIEWSWLHPLRDVIDEPGNDTGPSGPPTGPSPDPWDGAAEPEPRVRPRRSGEQRSG